MVFRDVPSLAEFEKHARKHSACPITLEAYKSIRTLIAHVSAPAPVLDMSSAAPTDGLKASCEAIEKSTRLLWACATATNFVEPPLWDYTPEYEGAVAYFQALDDLELMAITKAHRLAWDI